MGLKDLEKELYSTEGPEERELRYKKLDRLRESAATRTKGPAPSDSAWKDQEENTQAMPKKAKFQKAPFLFQKLFGFLALLAVAGLIYIGYSYMSNGNGAAGVAVSVEGPQEILVGVPFEIRAHITNGSRNVLTGSALEIALPEEVRAVESPDSNVVTHPVKDILPGASVDETVRLVALRGQKSSKELTVSLQYSISGVQSRFSQDARFIANIGESGLRLDTVYPNKALAGEEFTVDFSYTNISNVAFDNISLSLKYPPGYEFLRASKQPLRGSSTWMLGKIGPGEKGKVTIVGRVYGTDGSFFNISAQLIEYLGESSVVISEKEASLAIAPSPLFASVALMNKQESSVRTSESLQYTITYKNNTDVGLKDVIVKAQLTGEMYNLKTLTTNGFFESVNNTITWNAATTPELRLLAPGQTGSITFSVSVKPEYPMRRLSDKNYTLKVRAVVESPTVPFFVSYEKTTGIAAIETKVAGRIVVDAKALFRDAASGFLNTGPFPPKVNVPTQYTIHWIISNYATDISSIEARSILQSGATWTGKVKSTVPGSVPLFNERTGEVIWNIDKAYAGQGVLDKPIEAIFQVQLTPSILAAGRPFLDLLGQTTVTAHDEFTGIQLEASDQGLTTSLPDDPTVMGQTIITE